MIFARWLCIINGLAFALYGAFCAYNPQFVADITAMTAPNSALVEIRAMYGGLQAALGIFFIVMALKPQTLEAGMIALVLCYGGLATMRAWGVLLWGADNYNAPVLGLEFVSTLLAVCGLMSVRRGRANSL